MKPLITDMYDLSVREVEELFIEMKCVVTYPPRSFVTTRDIIQQIIKYTKNTENHKQRLYRYPNCTVILGKVSRKSKP